MDKKGIKKVIFVIGILMIIISIIAIIFLNRKDNIIEGPNNDFQGESNSAGASMKPINTAIELKDILQDVKNDSIGKLVPIEDSKANEMLNLRNYVGLEKMVAQYVSDNEFSEIWLLKISEESQVLDLFRIFNERIETLKEEYKNDEVISSIIKNEKNIIIKQQYGIVIMIISNEAENIEQIIDSNFKNNEEVK